MSRISVSVVYVVGMSDRYDERNGCEYLSKF